ncbi:MAG: hypothetical protein K2Y40_12355 [Reyranella sp.]|nr:hypothetical protein [Reyranella sp.]
MAKTKNPRPAAPRPHPSECIEALSWAEAADYKRIYRDNVRLPRHAAHLSLAERSAKRIAAGNPVANPADPARD